MGKTVLDISEHNGSIDFKKVKANGVSGVIIRAGYGKNNEDEMFKEYISKALDAGLAVGIYWFSYAYTVDMARNEAEYAMDAAKSYKLTLPIFFDWEYDSMNYARKCGVNPDRSLITAMNDEFCQTVKNGGYATGYYVNSDYERNYIDCSKLTEYFKWYAQYYSTCESDNVDIWQYSSDGNVSGISGRVDMNDVFNEKIFKTTEDKEMKFSEMPRLAKGTQGKCTQTVQNIIGIPTNGIFDAYMEAKVKQFQAGAYGKQAGITNPDGIIGAKTWDALFHKLADI